MQEIGLDYLLQHPVDYSRLHVMGIHNLPTNQCYAVKVLTGIYRGIIGGYGLDPKNVEGTLCPLLSNLLNIENLFFLVGLAIILLKRKASATQRVLLTLTVLYFVNIVGVFGLHPISQYPRHRLPIIPIIYITAALGLSEAYGFLRRNIKPNHLGLRKEGD